MSVKRERTPKHRSPPAEGPDADARGAGQKRRTRSALLASAAQLVAAGHTPSVADVADAADVSRRTAYRYFPTQEQLLTEASLEALRPEVEAALSAALPDDSGTLDDVGRADARLDAAVKVIVRLAVANEPLLRTMIRLTSGRVDAGRPTRGYRRIDWLLSAIAPVKTRLGPARFERLLSALTACVGMDSLFLLQDTRGLSPRAAERVLLWTAHALLAASVADADQGDR